MIRRRKTTTALAVTALLTLAGAGARANHTPSVMGVIDGVTGPAYTLTAKPGHISTPDGNSVLIWGFADGAGTVQYPGPTLIVNEGDLVQIDLVNALAVPVSIVFPGQEAVTEAEVAAPTAPGLLALEAGPAAGGAPGGTVRYSFTATHPGTYQYHSGTRPDVQVEMGLLGAIIVRPAGFMQDDMMMRTAYGDMSSMYDLEYLYLITEMDLRVHRAIEMGKTVDEVDTSDFFPVQWFVNGRCAMDTMYEPFASWLPTQPYNCMPMMEPGQKVLIREIGGGRDVHPFHHHGNHSKIIARDGRLLSSMGMGADLAEDVFTIQSVPGQTHDSIFEWTGEGIGWDVFGHLAGDPPNAFELGPDGVEDTADDRMADHGKPIPVLLPEGLDLAYGGLWSGSPYLGSMAALPPGEGGLNPWGGFSYMWHSHAEKELCNNDIFPGGLMAMLIIVPPGTMSMPPMPMAAGTINLTGGR